MLQPTLIPRFYQDISYSDFLSAFYKEQELKLSFENYLFTGSGRYSLFLILQSLEVSTKKIIVPAFICHVVFESILKAGFEPILVDIDEDLNLDIEKIGELKENFSVILANHTFGKKMDVKKLKAKFPNKVVIEDCCHFPASIFGKGELEGDYLFYSFGLSKYFTMGNGSLLITKEEKDFVKIKTAFNEFTEIQEDSFLPVLKKFLFATAYKVPFYGSFTRDLGLFMERFVDVSGKETLDFENLGSHFIKMFVKKMKNFEPKMAKQTENTIKIVEQIKNPKTQTLSKSYHSQGHINFMLPVFVEGKEDFHQFLSKNGIDSCLYLSNLNDYFPENGIRFKHCKRMTEAVSKLITIPNYFSLSDNQIKKITNVINRY